MARVRREAPPAEFDDAYIKSFCSEATRSWDGASQLPSLSHKPPASPVEEGSRSRWPDVPPPAPPLPTAPSAPPCNPGRQASALQGLARHLEACLESHTATILAALQDSSVRGAPACTEGGAPRRDRAPSSCCEGSGCAAAGSVAEQSPANETQALGMKEHAPRHGAAELSPPEFEALTGVVQEDRTPRSTKASAEGAAIAALNQQPSDDGDAGEDEADGPKRPVVSKSLTLMDFTNGTELGIQLSTPALDGRETWASFHGRHSRVDRCYRGCKKRLTKPFDVLSTAVLAANIVVVTLSTDREMRLLKPEDREWIAIVSVSFTIFFVVELFIRIFAEGRLFIYGPNRHWNIFDTTVVGCSLLVESGWSFVRTLRLLRVIKVVRSIRMVYLLRMSDLEKMINGISASFNLLCWSAFLLMFLALLFSILFVQGLATEIIESQALSTDEVEGMQLWFGSVGTGVVSLIMVATGGADWKDLFDAIGPAGEFYSAALIMYVILFTIAVWNVVTSIFVDKAMRFARLGDESVIKEQQRAARNDMRELLSLFRNVDVDLSGCISYEEFQRCIERKDFAGFLQSRGLDIHETKAFFKMLQGESQNVSIDQVVVACMRLRGVATSIDLHTMRFELRQLMISQIHLMNKMFGLRPARKSAGESGDSGRDAAES